MALYDPSTIQAVTNALGDADANLEATLNTALSTSARAQLILAHSGVFNPLSATDPDLDAALTLANALRTLEQNLPTQIGQQLTRTVTALNAYYTTTFGMTMRAYYDASDAGHTVPWSENFKTLYRKIAKDELIVRLGVSTRTAGAWSSFAADKTIVTASSLEIRTASAIGLQPITVNAILAVSGSGASQNAVAITIPASTPQGTRFTLRATGATQKFVGVTSLTVTGGTNGDSIEAWVA